MGGGYNETVVGAIGDWAISREAGQYGRGGVRWEADGALGELAAPTELHSTGASVQRNVGSTLTK